MGFTDLFLLSFSLSFPIAAQGVPETPPRAEYTEMNERCASAAEERGNVAMEQRGARQKEEAMSTTVVLGEEMTTEKPGR